jgi:hypothetical protein
VVDSWRDCGHAIDKRIYFPDANGLCADLFPVWRFGWNAGSQPSRNQSILEILEIPARTLSMGISATGSEGGSIPTSLAARVRSPCQYPIRREACRNGMVLSADDHRQGWNTTRASSRFRNVVGIGNGLSGIRKLLFPDVYFRMRRHSGVMRFRWDYFPSTENASSTFPGNAPHCP